jgi:O-methyltransferase
MKGRARLKDVSRRAIHSLRARRAPLAAPVPAVERGVGAEERAILDTCRPYTMASPQRLVATMDAVEHVVSSDIGGALVECGVWRGGSVLAMVLTLIRLGVDNRNVYLYDTFEGMTEPTAADTSQFDGSALEAWRRAAASGERVWDGWFGADVFGLDQVEQLLVGTGYPRARLHFIAGPVEETLPDRAPDTIAVLRLDTDWYESTRHELEHLYPRLRVGGVLLVDDYGHWEGARRAVDEYFEDHGGRPLLARTDYTGRLAVKLG